MRERKEVSVRVMRVLSSFFGHKKVPSVETPAGANSIGKHRQEPSRAASHLSPWHAGLLVLFRNRSMVQRKESAKGTSLLVHAIAIGRFGPAMRQNGPGLPCAGEVNCRLPIALTDKDCARRGLS